MQSPSGTFIVLEGADGSGKGTQFNLLKARLEAVGHDVQVFDFPRYDKESSYFVRQYLNGGFGKAADVNPYTSSIFFALDRYEAAIEIKRAIAAGKVVMSNRYVGSNMAHQGAKFNDPAEQRGFFVWEDNLEFELLGIPRPTLNIFLRVPAEISYELIAKKAARSYTTKKRDEHEADIDHLRKSVTTYELLCQLFPNDFTMIDCTKDGQLMSIPDINNLIWQTVQPVLPAKPAKKARAITVSLNSQSSAEAAKPADAAAQNIKLAFETTQAAYSEGLAVGLPLKAAGADWAKTDYSYLTPAGLSKKVESRYHELIGKIIANQKNMRAKIKKANQSYSLLAPAVPLAAKLRVELNADLKLLQDTLAKLNQAANPAALSLVADINAAAKASDSKAFAGSKAEAAADPEPIGKIIARLAADQAVQTISEQLEAVELVEAWPRNEFKALTNILYPRSPLTKSELEDQIDGLNYKQKSDALEAALKAGGAAALDQFSYQFKITADRLSLNKIMAAHIGSDLKMLAATPRQGYETAELIDQLGLTDEYLDCFDKSLELYSSLQAAGQEALAAYATLLGHKNSIELTCSLGSLVKLSRDPKELKEIVNLMQQKIAEQHVIAASILSAPKEEKPQPLVKPVAPTTEKKPRSHRGGRRRSNRPKKP